MGSVMGFMGELEGEPPHAQPMWCTTPGYWQQQPARLSRHSRLTAGHGTLCCVTRSLHMANGAGLAHPATTCLCTGATRSGRSCAPLDRTRTQAGQARLCQDGSVCHVQTLDQAALHHCGAVPAMGHQCHDFPAGCCCQHLGAVHRRRGEAGMWQPPKPRILVYD